MSKPSPVEKARDMLGGTNAMAKAMGVTAPTVSQWLNGIRNIPLERCPTLENLTGGEVTCEQLRPDIDWSLLRRVVA